MRSLTELPHKLGIYTALIVQMNAADAEIGAAVAEMIQRELQSLLDSCSWRRAKNLVRFTSLAL